MNSFRTGIFDSFNARFLRPEEVGATFVNSPFLSDILSSSNTAVLGPRGSGKTTLLKMLTLPAMLRWQDPARDAVAESLQYLAVYIPASLTWNADYRGFAGQISDQRLSDLISISLFRHGVLFSLLNTWQEAAQSTIGTHDALRRFYLPISEKEEARVVRALAARWELDTPISSVGGLREAVSNRVRVLQTLAVRSSYGGMSFNGLLDKFSFLTKHFFDDCTSFLDVMQAEYDFNQKVALCFDEIEIAPDAIANAIIKMPRSVDQRFLIKFSAAPYVGVAALREATDPTQRQDYKFILLSSFSVKETRRFSESLFDSVAMSHKVQQNSNEVLGASLVDEISTVGDASSRYKTRGSYQKKFKSLFEKDVSFKLYATSKGINIEDLSIGEENERAALIRKIIWPVFIREEFLFAPDFGALRKSSRRIRTAHQISDIYTGAASLFAICEGNPRQIIGLMGPILRAYGADQLASSRPVRRSLQKQLVQKMISAYFALVSTVPIGDQLSQARSLVDVISLIGNYFKDTVLGEEFDPDPVASFVIDAGVPPPIMEMVGKGINIGAFIVEDVTKSNTPYTLGEIVGLKARLSNIFAPHFRLPLAGGRTINLSTILSRDSKRSQPLLELFGLKI